jgi:hypothetical protein
MVLLPVTLIVPPAMKIPIPAPDPAVKFVAEAVI